MKSMDKKTAFDIPFTQLWQSFSRQCQKENIAPHKYNKSNRQESKELIAYKNIQDDILHKRRGFSLNNIHKKSNDLESSNAILKNITRQIVIEEENEFCNLDNNGDNSLFNKNNGRNNKSERNKSTNSINSMNTEGEKTTKKIIKVIELHFIPFIVDKFIELEQKISHKINSIEKIVHEQQETIKAFKNKEQKYELDVLQYRNIIESEFKLLNTKIKNAEILNKYPSKAQENIEDLFSSKGEEEQINRKYEELNKKTKKMEEELRVVYEKTNKMRENLWLDQKIEEVFVKIKQMEEKQSQKYEKELSQKILELICTYNNNFIDVDKRIYDIEQAISDNHHTSHNNKSIDGASKTEISL